MPRSSYPSQHGTQGYALVVNEVVENPEVSSSKPSGDKKYQVIFLICPSLGGPSYLIPVAGGRESDQRSRKDSRGNNGILPKPVLRECPVETCQQLHKLPKADSGGNGRFRKFLLVMEGLNNMIKKTNREGWLREFEVARVGSDSLKVTHQYADDTLILYDAEEEHLKILRLILVICEGMSGLHINRRKSFLYPVNEVPNMEILKSILGCEVSAPPTIYLGLLLGAKSMSMEIWNGVIEKCEKKLARWKSQYLSLGGRLTLISSVLDALPTYMMSLFPIPLGIINRLDSIRRKFLWLGNKVRKGYHLVKWKTVINEKRFGDWGSKI
ncbi:hypothetical protein MTR67_052123 [Solanum verrucosum]|uniref:Reverse transcriptase domain-containing protein n=1 Tax=Solanum verrucosum TaxID=315347 RepID=A0AAF0V8P8_SOLVR|nr:hypothetical protein MTR67_052123 [Solanum verrucosum]